ncbi:hypothetical protein [Streptomyces sp. Midd1]|uniref:hypothetical protein n=1 Tax=Streptomyces sp. Midd3 TaxID=3161191 RepID=UPI0034DB5E2E
MYADWLLKIFDHWEQQGRTVPVRTFDSVLSTLRGGPSLTEAMGLAPSDLAVVETNGSFEQADSLKTAYDGAPATGYDVVEHSFDEFALHPGVRARQSGLAGLSDTCRSCPVVESCGGGLYAHRYSSEGAFDNPSVFCEDLRTLVDGVAERITDRALSPVVGSTDDLVWHQGELNRTLLAAAADRHRAEPDWSGVWRAFLELDGAPDVAPHLDGTLAHPYVRTALRDALHDPASAAPLAATAVAVAVRARADLELRWDHPTAALHLPALGTLTLREAGPVAVSVKAGELRVSTLWGDEFTPGEASAGWRPVPTVPVADGMLLLLDDSDPLRDCYSVPVAEPLGPSGLARFAERLRRAYVLLEERHPLRAGPRPRGGADHRHSARRRNGRTARRARARRDRRGRGLRARGPGQGTAARRTAGARAGAARDGRPERAGQPGRPAARRGERRAGQRRVLGRRGGRAHRRPGAGRPRPRSAGGPPRPRTHRDRCGVGGRAARRAEAGGERAPYEPVRPP